MFGFVCLLVCLGRLTVLLGLFSKTPPNKGARRHERRGSFLFLGLRRSRESNQEHFQTSNFFDPTHGWESNRQHIHIGANPPE